MVKYNELRDDLKTGDIILISGKDLMSSTIKLFTRSKWSHVGMVFRLNSQVQIWEATIKHNVSLSLLSCRINEVYANDGKVAIRKLCGVNFTEQDHLNLDALRNQVKDTPYEKDVLEFIKSAWDGIFGQNEEDLSSIFCSELVAEAYQCLGLISQDLPSNEFIPKDFSQRQSLSLIKGELLSEIDVIP